MPWTMFDYEYERGAGYESVRVAFADDRDVVEIVANVVMRGGVVILSECHVGGSAANGIGVRRLLALIRWVKQEMGIHELRIDGAIRASGAGPGRRPAPLVFK